jgi:outer membrane protein assembly factor BamA
MSATIVERIIVVIVLLTVATTPSAQSSRTEQIAEQQREKAQTLGVESPSRGEVIVERAMRSPLLAGSGGFYPWVGSIYNGAGLALGAGYRHRSTRGARFSVIGAGTATGSVTANGTWSMPSFTSGGMIQPHLDARWSRLEALRFSTMGIDSAPDQRAQIDYTPREISFGLNAAVAPRTSLTASYGLLGFSTSVHGDDAAPPLLALGQHVTYGVARAGAQIDWRPSPGYSTRGGFVRGGWQRSLAAADRPYDFDEVEFEAAHTIRLVREQFGLAFRGLVTTTFTADGNDVPFVLLPTIGGGDTLRGFASRRFTDRSRTVLTGEYRWRPSRYLDMAVFLDAGSVAPRLRDLGDQPFKTSWGIGGRMHGETFTALRIEAAHSTEGWRFIFATSQPF